MKICDIFKSVESSVEISRVNRYSGCSRKMFQVSFYNLHAENPLKLILRFQKNNIFSTHLRVETV